MNTGFSPEVTSTHHVVGIYRNVVDTGWMQQLQATTSENGVADIHDADKARLHLFTDHEIDMMKSYPFESETAAQSLLEIAGSDTAPSTIQTIRKGIWIIERTGGIVVNLSAANVFYGERNAFGQAFEELTGIYPLIDNRGMGIHIGRLAAGASRARALNIIYAAVPGAITLLPAKVKTKTQPR